MNETKKASAYKEPWFWAVMGPLLVVIMVSLSMAGVAIWGADDRVTDDYFKEGRMINKHFAAEALAMSLAVRGSLEFDFTTAEVFAQVEAKKLPAELELTLSHPSAAAQDMTLVMQRVGEGRYRADLPTLNQGRWYLIIGNHQASADDRWQVSTEVDFRRSNSAQFSAHL
jgi:hypothetical protein